MNHSQIKNPKGVVIVEFAIILPIILMISLCAFEISRAIRLMSVASKLSFEVAKVSLKECFDGGSIIGIQPLDQCLDEKQRGVQNLAEAIVPGTKIFVSYYVVENESAPASAKAWSKADGSPKYRKPDLIPDNLKAITNRTKNSIAPSTRAFDALKPNRKIIIGECFLPYNPLFAFVRIFLPFKTIENYMYDATIV